MRWLIATLLLQVLAYLPVWEWYVARLLDGSDEPWGLAAFIVAVAFSIARWPREMPNDRRIFASLILAIVYLLSASSFPMLLRAFTAVLSIAVLFAPRTPKGQDVVAFYALLLLSLPIIATLQFYLGYPVRLVTAHLCAFVLSLFGTDVVAMGTALQWYGELVAVDAPCSGVKMLWAGMFLNFTLATHRSLAWRRTWKTYIASAALIFAGNFCRTFILFFTESGLLTAPSWFHQGIGMIIFAGVCLSICWIHNIFKERADEASLAGGAHSNCY